MTDEPLSADEIDALALRARDVHGSCHQVDQVPRLLFELTAAAFGDSRRPVGNERRGDAPFVREVLVERPHAHRPDPFGNQIADRIIDHRGRHAGLQLEAIGQVRRNVELAAAKEKVAQLYVRWEELEAIKAAGGKPVA